MSFQDKYSIRFSCFLNTNEVSFYNIKIYRNFNKSQIDLINTKTALDYSDSLLVILLHLLGQEQMLSSTKMMMDLKTPVHMSLASAIK